MFAIIGVLEVEGNKIYHCHAKKKKKKKKPLSTQGMEKMPGLLVDL